jgi:uncharacterized protein
MLISRSKFAILSQSSLAAVSDLNERNYAMTASVFTRHKSKRAILPMIAALTMALSVVAAQAQAPEQKSQVDGRVIVTGEGSITVSPNYAQIKSGVTTDAKTVKEASDGNTKLMNAIMQVLLDSGIAQKDIQTSQFSIEPIYTSQSSSAAAKLSGYRVSNQVTVTLRQISQVGEILDRLIKAGATDVGHIAFLVSEPEKALDQARETALADARRKAELYARAAGVHLGRVAWITEKSDMPVFPMGVAEPRQKMAQHVPVQSGEETLRASITVGFDIAQ